MPRRKNRIYSTGDYNKMVDLILHPLARKDVRVWVLDGLIHSLLEQDPAMSAKKFVHFNLPEILNQISKEIHIKKRRRLC